MSDTKVDRFRNSLYFWLAVRSIAKDFLGGKSVKSLASEWEVEEGLIENVLRRELWREFSP